MAYMSQERKQQLAPAIKKVLDKYGMKGTIAVRHHSTLVVNIRQGKLDLIANYNQRTSNTTAHARDYIDVNPYWFHDHFEGTCKDFLTELFAACNAGNHDNSDIQTDYFDVGWYVDVNIGKWGKPYALAA